MRKIFNKVLAGVTATAMAATLLIGVNVAKSVSAAEDVTLVPWSFYEGGQMGRSNDPDGWPVRVYNSVSTTAGETQGKSYWQDSQPNQQFVDGPEVTWDTTQVADGFTADIDNTGWDGDYSTGTLTGDNPYLLRAYMTGVQGKEGHDYTLSFKAKWTNAEKAPEKNIAIGIGNAYGESVFKDVAEPVTQIKVASGSTVEYSQDFTLWAGDTLDISLAYGAFLVSHDSKLTTEDVAAKGVLQITDFKLVDKGQNPDYIAPPSKATTSAVEITTTQAPTTAANVEQPTTAPTTVTTPKVLGKVSGLKVKAGKKKVTVSWAKVANAKSYQVKVGKKTYTASGTKKVVKKLKSKKKVTVKVRALAPGFTTGKWSAAKKVKVK